MSLVERFHCNFALCIDPLAVCLPALVHDNRSACVPGELGARYTAVHNYVVASTSFTAVWPVHPVLGRQTPQELVASCNCVEDHQSQWGLLLLQCLVYHVGLGVGQGQPYHTSE